MMGAQKNLFREFKFPKKYNAIEFLEFTKDKEDRYELIDGRIHMMAAPNVRHQDIAGEIYFQLKNYLKGKKCRPFIAALDVVLFEKSKEDKSKSQNVFQPDVFVVCDPEKIEEDRIYGSPDLVIEIVSPSSKIHDYFKKFEIYKKYGVKEYWIVNPITKEIFVHIDRYDEVEEYSFGDKIKVGIFDDFEIDFKELNI